MKQKAKGPEFTRFFLPVLRVLRSMGGSGVAAEVTDRAIEHLKIPESEQVAVLKNGDSRVRNQVQWARFYLAKAGLIDSSRRGVWTLTEEGQAVDLDALDAFAAFKLVHNRFVHSGRGAELEGDELRDSEPSAKSIDDDFVQEIDFRTRLLDVIKALPPQGFERLCQRLLREAGFQQVEITGRSGDGGIDGYGILKLNPFVSSSVLFQCKRYQGSVSPSQVRDFRGTMQGRTDKGIIITTGSFTVEAKKEARRDGAPPIEIVSGEDLIDLFIDHALGVVPRITYDINEKFFEEFRN